MRIPFMRYKNLSVNMTTASISVASLSKFLERLCVWNERRKNPDSSTAGAVGFQSLRSG
jgi:hypothetical protein